MMAAEVGLMGDGSLADEDGFDGRRCQCQCLHQRERQVVGELENGDEGEGEEEGK